jgi:hypothetical protein
MFDFPAQRLDGYLPKPARYPHVLGLLEHPTCIRHDLLGDADQLTIFVDLPVAPLLGGHALDLLHAAPSRAATVGKSTDTCRQQFPQTLDQTGDDPHAIPQQGIVGGMVNVGFDHGAIGAQLLAVFQAESDGGSDHRIVDGLKRRGCQPVKGSIESIVLGNRLAMEVSEAPQGIPVGDALAQFAVVPVLDPHQGQRTERLLSRKPVASGVGLLQTFGQIASNLLDQFCVLVDEIRDRLQHGLQLDILAQELQIGKTELRLGGSAHFFSF